MPAIVNANIGYASGTTDAGQPWYQDGSFAFSPTARSMSKASAISRCGPWWSRPSRPRALVNLYYGKAPKYAYYDGHSQGGRQGMKIAQEYPELY